MRLSLKTLLASAATLISLASITTGGAANTTIRIASATGSSGDELTVRLELAAVPDPGLGAFTIDVAYDPDVVSAVSCEGDPDGVLDTIVCNEAFASDTVRVPGFRTTEGLTGQVALADLTFKLTGDEGECSDLIISVPELTDNRASPLTVDVQNGSICIGEEAAATWTPAPASESTPRPTPKPGETPSSGDQGGGVTGSTGGTPRPGQPNATIRPGLTPGSIASTNDATAQAGGNNDGDSATSGTPGAKSTRSAGSGSTTQNAESGSGGSGRNALIIAVVAVVAAALIAGAGAFIWRRSHR